MVSKKRRNGGLSTYKPTLKMKYSELRKTEFIPEQYYDAWRNYCDGLAEFRDKKKIRSEFAWSLKLKNEDDVKRFNDKNKKLMQRRKLKKLNKVSLYIKST
jgi:hypothetical protein